MAQGKVQDLVFSAEPVGPGLAIDTARGARPVGVAAPVSGTAGKAHPHTFAIRTSGGACMLVHPGIDTVRLDDSCFAVHVTEAEDIQVGWKTITFDADMIRDRGLAAERPVVVLAPASPGFVQAPVVTGTITTGALLFGRAAS